MKQLSPDEVEVLRDVLALPSGDHPTPDGLSTIKRLRLRFQVSFRGVILPSSFTITGPISELGERLSQYDGLHIMQSAHEDI